MLAVLRPFAWFYEEFGLVSIHQAGRNAYLTILARSCRMFAYGICSLILALFFAELNFSDTRIGLFMTLTLFGDVILGSLLTLVADRVGRRRILFFGSFLMVLSGMSFAVFENFWLLLFAAVIGVISATGGDFGPFRAIEESVLSQLTTPKTRADVLAWYVTMSSVGSAIGSEVCGRVIHALQTRYGWELVEIYHALFWVYSATGLVNAALMLFLTEACELSALDNNKAYSQVPQDDERASLELDAPESAGLTLSTGDNQSTNLPTSGRSSLTRTPFGIQRYWKSVGTWLSLISAPTLTVMYKLWFLLALDSIADGMVPYPLTNYYTDLKFHPSKSTLGDVQSVAYFLGAASSVFAGPLARKIGLINTMVFTHIPSSAAVLVFPLPGSLWMTVILLLVRAGLNNMDQAPRSAFIAAVVKPEERTAVMGITSTLRTLAAVTGPTITGLLAGHDRFWIAFVAAGAFRLAYDVGLYVMFVNMKLYQHERGSVVDGVEGREVVEDHEMTEMEDLASATESTVSEDSYKGSK
ncbi:hypothetical protein LTR08_008626 [Meristemomyces frigidus]|nr:hypothetical protein LTR08_008626 [Meristemomyces frigidus]